MTRLQLLGWLLLIVFSPAEVHAEVGRVVVVQPAGRGVRAWPAATRAAVAELALAGFEVTVQKARRTTIERILPDLRSESDRAGVVAAVLITRTDNTGSAHVCLHGVDSPLLITEAEPDGAVAQGAITLKLTELMRKRSLHLPEARQPAGEPAMDSEAENSAGSGAPVATPWLAVGATWSRRASLAPLVALGTQLRLPANLSLGLESTGTLTPMKTRTRAGTAELDAASFGVHLLFDPLRSQSLSFAVGVGASALWVRSSAIGAEGYTGQKDTAAVGVLGATLRAALRHGSLGLQLMLEPGIAVPSVRVLAGDAELSRLGRPLVVGLLGVSWDL